MNTQGEGSVTVASSNPAQAMIIDPQTFTHACDHRVLNRCIERNTQDHQQHEVIQRRLVFWLMGPKSEAREDLEAFVDGQTLLVWYAIGTVKMGREEDESACVDSDFRVRGVAGLRVANMSVPPVLVR